MSLGDYLRQLRARQGGITPQEIEAATDMVPGVYRQMEQRYRAVGDDASITCLAEYYHVPIEELRWRLDWPRKSLSRALVTTEERSSTIQLDLWNGEKVGGKVAWWDLGAIGLRIDSGELLVVQRHAVERWEPRYEAMSASEGSESSEA